MPITFEIEYLRNLKTDTKSCVYVQHGQEHLALHPFQLENVSNSIKELLNKNIARYCSNLRGILLGYDNIRLLASDGLICDDSCFVHVDIEADFYVFKPEIDCTLQGVINKISKDHLACLVHKTFTISLPKPEDTIRWIGNKAQIGEKVQFTIVDAKFEGSLPYIRGNIISLDNIDDSGFSTNEDQVGHEENQILESSNKTKVKKRKFTKSDEDQDEEARVLLKHKKRNRKQSMLDVQTETTTTKKEKKRKKKLQHDLLQIDLSAIHGEGSPKNLELPEFSKEVRKNTKRKNASLEVEPSIIIQDGIPKIERKGKKRKSNLLNVGVEDHNGENATENTKLELIEIYAENENNTSRRLKKKGKSKRKDNESAINEESTVDDAKTNYEGLLKRPFALNSSLIIELNDLLADVKHNSTKEKKKRKRSRTSEASESVDLDLNTLFEPRSSTSKNTKAKYS